MLIGIGSVQLWQIKYHTSPRLIHDNGGQIQLAVLSVNSARSSTIRNAQLSSDIVNALPIHTKILLLAPDRSAFSVLSNPWKDRVQFVETLQDLSLTIWPQDPFLVISKKGQPYLLVSREFERAEDSAMADSIARHLRWPVQKSELMFEGGNIVSDDDYAYIGANTIVHNAIKYKKTSEEIVRRFQQELGQQVMVIGPVPQPIGHIDMMLTPLGNKHLLLADAKWGAALAKTDLQKQAALVRQFEQQSMSQFFGHPNIKQLVNKDGEIIRPPEISGATQSAIADSEKLGVILDKLAERLQQAGFTISRIPFLSQKVKLPEADSEDKTNRPGYPQITYNNVLLETTRKDKTAYIPNYGWQSLDEAARKVWRNLGYKITAIDGFTTTAMYGGALRCSVKVLKKRYD